MFCARSTRLLCAFAILLPALQLSGCAATLTAEAQYEEKARQAERMDEIRNFITACHSAGMIAVYYGPTTHKLRNPLKQIPRHARRSDYVCASERDVGREMGVGG